MQIAFYIRYGRTLPCQKHFKKQFSLHPRNASTLKAPCIESLIKLNFASDQHLRARARPYFQYNLSLKPFENHSAGDLSSEDPITELVKPSSRKMCMVFQCFTIKWHPKTKLKMPKKLSKNFTINAQYCVGNFWRWDFKGLGFSYSYGPNQLVSNGFWQNGRHLLGFQMIGLPDFRSHSKSRPFANQPLFDHSKSRLVQLSNRHYPPY